ncbi:substrate-binding domain-containing protein [Azohydromonas aeria]|uniref:substrate-binding domain-containing protein n=1 Tax=Azohydromonas aeria TaxID=2590212 RepID=UPI0012F7D1AE|nr:substrate-binding domain-containing protein [Azohydromonas aeria]
MRNLLKTSRRAFLAAGLALGAAMAAHAGEIRVVSSGGFTAAYNQLVPLFEAATGHKVVTAYGSSMGTAQDSIPSRLGRGEQFDIVILADGALEALARDGKVVPNTRVDLGRSLIGMSVRKGLPKPDISTVEGLKKTVLEAKAIAYSASASGTYLSNELFPKLGVWEQIKDKSRKIMSERVGTILTRGEADVGFQQVSELLPFKDIEYVGPLPEEVQQKVFFSAGLAVGAREPELAAQLVKFLASSAAAPIVKASGLDPVAK